jgi:hypothetical protein
MVMATIAPGGFHLDADAHADLPRRIGREVASAEGIEAGSELGTRKATSLLG